MENIGKRRKCEGNFPQFEKKFSSNLEKSQMEKVFFEKFLKDF